MEMEPNFWLPPFVGPWFLKRTLMQGAPDAIEQIELLAQQEQLAAAERSGALTVYTARSAVATGSRAARTAGSSPPMKPTEHASSTPTRSNPGVTCILNTIDPMLSPSVTVLPLKSSHAIAAPTPAPINAKRSASTSTDTMTPPAPNPIARSVAISRVRTLTAEYIVFSAAKIAPSPMKTRDGDADEPEDLVRFLRRPAVELGLALDGYR